MDDFAGFARDFDKFLADNINGDIKQLVFNSDIDKIKDIYDVMQMKQSTSVDAIPPNRKIFFLMVIFAYKNHQRLADYNRLDKYVKQHDGMERLSNSIDSLMKFRELLNSI